MSERVEGEKNGICYRRCGREKHFDTRAHLLPSGLSLRSRRAFDSTRMRPAMSEAVLSRVEWRRGDLNPSPVKTSVSASTCLSDFLISIAATKIDILRRGPVVFISLSDQRPNQ